MLCIVCCFLPCLHDMLLLHKHGWDPSIYPPTSYLPTSLLLDYDESFFMNAPLAVPEETQLHQSFVSVSFHQQTLTLVGCI